MRRLAELAVRFRITFLMIYVLVLGAGVYFGFGLKLDMYPDITFPVISVVTTYTGASPEDVEQLITRPVEEACAAVEGVKHVSSESKHGASMVLVEFKWGTNLDAAETDIRRNLDFFREVMPDDASQPITFAFDPSMQPILFFGISGPFEQGKLKEIAKREIEPRFERIPGVASAEALGGVDREIRVEIMPDRLAAIGISVQQIIGALRMENLQVPAGSITTSFRDITIRTGGEFQTVEEIREAVIGIAGNVPVRLRDVAVVKDTVVEKTRVIRAGGKSAIMLMVRKQSGANTVQTVEAVRDQLPAITSKLPAGIELSTIFDQADFINRSLANLSTTGMLAILMAILILFVFLRSLAASVIVGLAIPVSVVVTFSVMYSVGVTLNIISMAGLALAVGMLVDNSIVVLENIYRHLEGQKTARQAAIDGAGEVATAIFGSTLTTIAVFLPILFVPGLAGAMFRDMALTICISLGASFLVAITLIPLAASTVIRGPKRFSTLGIEPLYSKLQALTIARSRLARGFVFVFSWMLLMGSLGLLYIVGTEFFPKEDQALVLLQLKSQVGDSVDRFDKIYNPAEKLLMEEIPELELLTIDMGIDDGFTAMFSEGQHAGLIRARLTPLEERDRKQKDVEEEMRKLLADVPGLESKVFVPFGPTGEADISLEIVGHDLGVARKIGEDVQRIIEGIDGAKDVVFSLEQSKPELRVNYDRDRISRLGLTSAAVSGTVSSFFQGTIAGVFREDGNDYDIRVRAPRRYRSDINNLRDLTIISPIAGSLPLRSIATVSERAGPVKITRKDQQRLVTVNANSVSRDFRGLIGAIEERLSAYPWPEGYRYHVGGAAEDFLKSFGYLALALVVSMLLVYMVMASLFESLLTPLVIGFTIPLAMTGVGVGLFLSGTVLSVVALIGIVVLVGIVVNNSIVLIDHANHFCAEGLSRLEAIVQASRHRLRPILMTTLTTTLAMVPLALELGSGAESWSPLARVVIGGLLMATLVTLLVVPIIYLWFGGGAAARKRAL